MREPLAWGLFCGCVLGIGLWSLVGMMPRLSRPRLVDRVAPYVLDVSAGARAHTARQQVDPVPVLGILFAPLFGRLLRSLIALMGDSEGTRRRLDQAGSRSRIDQFRAEQLVYALVGFAVGVAVVFVVPSMRGMPLALQVVLPPTLALSGALARDWRLQGAAKARLARMESELPTVLEFLTLSLSAGEGILDALRRVSATSSGELAREFAGVVHDVQVGVPLAAGLNDLSRRIHSTPLTRCIDQVTSALERGSPIAEVLRAQAQDARDDSKRRLLEIAGKKEVAMLVPLVFLILPMTVVFAIFPGIFVLQSGF
jgi:tight adherence protein C